MPRESDHPHAAIGTGHRVVTGALGALLLGSGVYALRYVSDSGALQLLGALGCIAVGANAVLSAWRARASWISRIGPLP